MLLTSPSSSTAGAIKLKSFLPTSTNHNHHHHHSLFFRSHLTKQHPGGVSCCASKKECGGRFEKGRFERSYKDLCNLHILVDLIYGALLVEQGLMSSSDYYDSIVPTCGVIEIQIEDDEFVWRTDREDVHTNIEAALIDLVGEPAKKLQAGRSQNDQIPTDFRWWCRDAIDTIHEQIENLQVALVNLAKENDGVIVPGYTHLQRAQPVLLQHHILAYVEMLERDKGRLLDCRERLNFCPLGACASAGLPIDRFVASDSLEFTAPMRNSVDAVSDRDFVLEFLSANSITAVHLSRLGEEWVLWASEEFGFITPSDSVSTGSVIGDLMTLLTLCKSYRRPYDTSYIVRGKSARVIGDLMTLLTLCKGLPLAYSRDLQEDKEPVFDSVKTIIGMLEVLAEFAQNIAFNLDRIQKTLPSGHLDATTLADYLVHKGLPFRTGHDIVGRAVALCINKSCQLQDLSLDEFLTLNPVFDEGVYDYLGVENSVKKFSSYGSTGSECVADQLNFWISKLDVEYLNSLAAYRAEYLLQYS